MTAETSMPPAADVSPRSGPPASPTVAALAEDDATTGSSASGASTMSTAPVGSVSQVSSSRVVRVLWTTGGGSAVALGSVGVVVPGLPTTGFFILAAWCFSHSSPRFEQWVLNLPKIGPMVVDHRVGLGMPRRAKVIAISMIWLFSLLSSLVLISTLWVSIVVLVLAVIGTAYIMWRVPTREKVLAERAATVEAGEMIVMVEEISVTRSISRE